MTGTIDKIVADIRRGSRAPVYLLFGDELVAREGAKAIVDALVPEADQSLSVEVVGDDDAPSIGGRLRTLPLLGGVKVVVAHSTKAFVSKHNAGEVFRRSWEAWRAGNADKAVQGLRQATAAAGLGHAFLERAAKGDVPESLWEQVLRLKHDDESERWLQETSGRALTDSVDEGDAPGGGVAQVYEDLLREGIPPGAVLIVTAEVADQRRALFKRMAEAGVAVDCGVRTGRLGETQMRPEVARARIKDAVSRAGKRIDEDAVTGIVERTGFSVRALESELEKILLYVGGRTDIRKVDALEVLSSSREASIFDLTSALEAQDAGGALRALRALAVQREAAQATLAMMAGTIRSLILARAVLDRRLEGRIDAGMPYAAFQARVMPRLAADAEADDASVTKIREMHPFRAFNLLKAACRFTPRDLVRGLEAIHDADLALKTSGQPEGLILETLAVTLCGGEERKG